MKFTNYLKEIDNVAIYPIISLVLFTAIFALATVFAFSASKKKMDDNAQIPLH